MKKLFVGWKSHCYNSAFRFLAGVQAGQHFSSSMSSQRSRVVYDQEVELSVGQTIRVGDMLVTVLDIDDDEVHIQVDSIEDGDEELIGASLDKRFAPR